MASPILLPVGSNVSVKVHPVVLFSICDAYTRRKENQDRVIGTLLGVVVDNIVEVKHCYTVPHTESSEQVALDMAHYETMYNLHQKVASNEVIVGWFATGSALYNSDGLIQSFYRERSDIPHPVHLVVDTTLDSNKLTVQAYISRQLSLGDKVLAHEFLQVPSEVLFSDVERVGADLMLTGFNDPSPEVVGPAAAKPLSDLETLQASIGRLQELSKKATDYVDQVVSGKIPGNPAIGRYLADSVAMVPHFSKADFERLYNESVQDMMTVTYLSNLLRAHVALAEKLGTAALPIM